ncbi:MAG: potassium-transporting ATPase subunit KdpA [Lentisphaerae bacterium RIFOXYB12_FULL_65_16]|nr:MAG: potassium-transporting ATPase subunit KdpA [Lentisphaerae bacterium RIFOXYA12_64_32]OGV90405.1 MAG: potassium-transporting ATPase subunit KdpA [Lentisphaerae bacterium RIFOXYB12_FULL_65_16]
MTTLDTVQVLLYLGLLIACTPWLGGYMARVFTGERAGLTGWLAPVERCIYRLAGCDPQVEMRWTTYAGALLAFNLFGLLALLGLQLLQGVLPLNPQHLPGVPFGLALNTAISFTTNTNWQAYSGEATLSYLTQMLGLTVQNFVSAATGIAVLLALTRGLTRRSGTTLGNFWADLVRATLYILLPLSSGLALVLVAQGVVQTLAPYIMVHTVEGGQQLIPLGPAASQVAIKQLGTNGGGFFGVNSAHPFENPTPLTNFLEMFAILLIPAALTYTYGRMVGSRRQGWAIFAAMLILFLSGFAVALTAETGHTGNMEGKETRFGIVNSVLWATATTAASNGSVNAMHDSLSPGAGLVALGNMLLGEVVFGGVGAGLYGMLMFMLLTVFMAGLMVGRTPEYLGKKVEAREVTLAMVAVLAPCATVLVFAALAVLTPAGLASISNPGPHGLSQVLYAFASTANNNGSAFAGLNANTGFYNYLGGIAMLIGRFAAIVPALAIAGSMAGKKTAPPSPGTFPTDGALFVVLLIGVVLLVGALTFLPVLTLGPVLEHLLLQQGRVF